MSLRRYSVEDIFQEYSARKAGVVRALTHDVENFFRLCDPDKDNLCLYGHTNKSWEVTPPPEDVPPKMPEPVLGINFTRDGMQRRDWLSLVAVFSDSWLLSLAFYLGATLDRNERERLFKLINEHPTVFEVVIEKNPLKDKPTVDSSSKPQGGTKRTSDGQGKSNPKFSDEGYKVEEDDHSETLCISCGGKNDSGDAWICCDICEKWFHGKCAQIIPAMAASLKRYKCPSCSMRRVVTEKKLLKDKATVDSSSKPQGDTKRSSGWEVKSNPNFSNEGYKEDHSESICGNCSGNNDLDEFWIACDTCEKWFHGSCVLITPTMAANIDQYECPSCSIRRGRL
ncbi:hypothetical protein K1719_032940 [Acacia pycnantha]|nr:hypothetical protein K1719_032940 [Acacia pycnantha]